MKQNLLVVCLLFLSFAAGAQYDGNTTPTYPELIKAYKELAAAHPAIELYEMGPSDYGLPIYLCVLNGAGDSLSTFQKARTGTTLLINNAIHPGEPDGVNACLIWIQNWVKKGLPVKDLPLIAIVPAYNVGGMMNRSGTSRANQNGPEEYGFRGNAQNLDLNRDCIKSDSKNMFTFAKLYHALDPDVFLDTHVSNGADYQYTMTYIASVRERMAPALGDLMHDRMVPYLKTASEKRGFELVPYVHTKGETPETGIEVFNDLPRYIMGYASLFNAISFTLETHMLKPFPQRVQSTLVFIDESINWMKANSPEIEAARKKAMEWDRDQQFFHYNFKLTDEVDSIRFKGYAFSKPKSEVTGLERLQYHQDQPYDKMIPYYRHYSAKDSVRIPGAIVVGSQCQPVIDRLLANNVRMERVEGDAVTRQLYRCRIATTESGDKPYEGHYLHQRTKVEWQHNDVLLKPGDYIIPMNQSNRRFIMELLQPDAPDSYFAWNFFDSYIQQKEYFSPYVFEDKAAELLQEDPGLREKLEERCAANLDFKNSSWEQLYFIYCNSPYYEPTHNYLPVFYDWK